jgi:hypothetical protein
MLRRVRYAILFSTWGNRGGVTEGSGNLHPGSLRAYRIGPRVWGVWIASALYTTLCSPTNSNYRPSTADHFGSCRDLSAVVILRRRARPAAPAKRSSADSYLP